ncbi:Fructokinase [Calidithermus terrae]|uniref:Fructokinase n=1 Tax=Calidithermus terrae TaxID=1408545 RepID=A0A399F0H1_9DEIN|nr:carbohydrate kinase [Calidithermus terrae]RIH88071.1 Fructokinase [Calidithermus terrae]
MIIACGEALIDFTSLPYGGRTVYRPHPGGSLMNVAVASGRLGAPTGFLGKVSHDAFGRLLRQHLQESGVSLGWVVEAREPTTLAFVHLETGEPEYSFYAGGTADRSLEIEELPALPKDAALHFGSISLVLEPTAGTLEYLMQQESRRRFLSLDPNVRPGLIPDRAAYLERLEGWLGLVDLVKVSQADLEWLYPGESPKSIAQDWLAKGPALVLVTLGGAGSLALNANATRLVPVPKVEVADTVGAGDSFMGAALAWLHRHGRLSRAGVGGLEEPGLEQLLTFANQAAAINCTRPGADPPWGHEVDSR